MGKWKNGSYHSIIGYILQVFKPGVLFSESPCKYYGYYGEGTLDSSTQPTNILNNEVLGKLAFPWSSCS